jgi:hypothetical protein
VADIRKIDFKNFIYQVGPGDAAGHSTVRLRNGTTHFRAGEGFFSFNLVAYGDLTGDGVNEAAVILTGNSGGMGYWEEGFIYTIRDGQAVKIANFDAGDKFSGVVSGVKIENQSLFLDRPDFERCGTCSRTMRYRFSGTQLVDAGSTRN